VFEPPCYLEVSYRYAAIVHRLTLLNAAGKAAIMA
jgi:hypothetical protein